jgi:NAD+ synthase (glutamine-hydrolysing)
MRITIAQLNFHIGNFDHNKNLICNSIREAKKENSDLVIFSELSVPGYPPLDLLDRDDFIEKCNLTVSEIARECIGITAIVGSPTANNNPEGKKLCNSALVLSEGRIIHRVNKALLPTYDIFDEYRYFEPGRQFMILPFRGVRIAVTICEDLWDEQPFDEGRSRKSIYTVSPMDELAKQSPDLVINISASPFSYSNTGRRTTIFAAKARKHRVPIITANQTGANTELIFDGASLVIDREGEIFRRLPFFEEALTTFSLDDLIEGKRGDPVTNPGQVELVHRALVTGIRDYFMKSRLGNCIVGLSGGIDSALCLCLAAESLGPANTRALLMPSRYSSDHSVKDAVELAKRLNVKYDIISIEKPFRAFEEELSNLFAGRERDVTEENIQARIRALLLMAVSNKFGCILLNTSNKSEAAVGYGTLYGDMAGGLSVLGDVYKTDIYRIAEYINNMRRVIPDNILTKPPSAELRPNQVDTDSLPDYTILDSILYQYIELQRPEEKILGEGIDRDTVSRVIRLINNNEYKRYQSPPVLRISSKSFGSGRRMPLVARY